MIKITPTFVFALISFIPSIVTANETTSCVKATSPLISVSDFDANGIVDSKDISHIARHIGNKKPYYALYDRNADGLLDNVDLFLATRDMGKNSSQFDNELATIYTRFKNLQTVQGYQQLSDLGYTAIPVPLRGHGVHWFNADGMSSLMGAKQPSIYSAEGLNVSTDEKRIHALFWAAPASPVFANGATDYPDGESWKDSPVVSFSNMPTKLTSSAKEMWHKHAGLCMPLTKTVDSNGNDVITGEAHQYMTYNDCQALPSNYSMNEDGSTLWANFWMVHMWLFDINANGFFAGTHPCVEQDAPSADFIVGGRNIPEFFEEEH